MALCGLDNNDEEHWTTVLIAIIEIAWTTNLNEVPSTSWFSSQATQETSTMAAGFVRQALLFACVFAVHLFSEHEVLSAKNLERSEGFAFAVFVRNFFQYLNATKVGSFLVQKMGICGYMCMEHLLCFSYNVAAQPDINGHFVCELLASDMYNSSDQLLPHPDFHHYSIKVSYLFNSSHHDIRNPLNNFDKLIIRISFLSCTVPLMGTIHELPADIPENVLFSVGQPDLPRNTWQFKILSCQFWIYFNIWFYLMWQRWAVR